MWGVEREDPVYGLALVNMIFRGDGKSGLQDGSCFDHEFWQDKNKSGIVCMSGDTPPTASERLFTRVFMNPPFKRANDETEFVDYALSQCRTGALLFAILPHINVGGTKFHDWRIETLKRHTLKAVIKFVPTLFYPVMERTYGIIFEAHRPHQIENDKVFMSYLFDDNSHPRPSKMKSLHKKRDNVESTTSDLKKFIAKKSVKNIDIPRERIITTLRDSYDEGIFEPQTYINNLAPKSHPDIKDKSADLFKTILLNNDRGEIPIQVQLERYPIMDFVKNIVKTPLDSLKNYEGGDIPVVSATAYNNGIKDWKNIPDEYIVRDLMSISKTHEGDKACQAFWHPYEFSAINTVHLVEIISDFTRDIDLMLYLCQQIGDSNSWRFDYARPTKLEEVEVYLPVKSDKSINFDEIKRIAKKMHHLNWKKYN